MGWPVDAITEFDVVIIGAGAGAKLIWGSLPNQSVAVVEELRVGHTVASARNAGMEPVVAETDMMPAAVRSITDGQPQGWSMVLADRVTGVLIGATAMGQGAEEWITMVSLGDPSAHTSRRGRRRGTSIPKLRRSAREPTVAPR